MTSLEQIAAEQKQYEDALQEELALDKSTMHKPQKVQLDTTLVKDGRTIHLRRDEHYFQSQPLLEPFIDALNAKVRVDDVDYENQKATVTFLDNSDHKMTIDCDELLSQEYLCESDVVSPRSQITEHFAPLMGDFARVLGEAATKD